MHHEVGVLLIPVHVLVRYRCAALEYDAIARARNPVRGETEISVASGVDGGARLSEDTGEGSDTGQEGRKPEGEHGDGERKGRRSYE